MSPRIHHGGRDAGPTPRVDASTNANPLGPSPIAVEAVAACDLGPYPDPDYLAVRESLAEHAGVTAAEVVVGAGASELIHRLVGVVGGPVLIEGVTFGEYEAAARGHGVEVVRADPQGDLVERLSDAAIAFVASPGNPDGKVRDADWCEAVARRAAEADTTLVWDLAYAPFLEPGHVPIPDGAVRLWAPNKIHGCTGLRAGWLSAPAELASRLREAAVSWLVSSPAVAFLEATATDAADRWVAGCRTTLAGWRDALAEGLRTLGLDPEPGDAPFVVVEVVDAERMAARLRRDHGVKVRDTTSLGRPGAWRIAAQPPAQQAVLLDAVGAVLAEVSR